MAISWIVDSLKICIPYLWHEYTLIARTDECRRRKDDHSNSHANRTSLEWLTAC